MKKVLLISNHVFHYRQKVYNYFFDAFNEDGYEFHVLSDYYQKVDFQTRFVKHEEPFSAKGYITAIKRFDPRVVVLFLHMKDKIMLPIIYYCRLHNIPVIYWNHGINIMTPNNKIKNAIFHFIHSQCTALITYTPDMKKDFTKKSQSKLFVAYNTINMSEIEKSTVLNKVAARKKYGIKESKVILMVARLTPNKRTHILVEMFGGLKDVAVVIVGPGMYEDLQVKINSFDNVYYLGEKYGYEINEIYNMGDVFTTPGSIGLAMNEALFWGLPVILNKGIHGPEIYYMKNGRTGFLADDEAEYKHLMFKVLADDELLNQMSQQCLDVYKNEVCIERMYDGFIKAVHYCLE